MKAYKDCDEWLDEELSYEEYGTVIVTRRKGLPSRCEHYVKEAWRQATRTARVQQQILIGELKEVKRRLHELEDQIEDWTMEAKVRDEYDD